MATDFLFSVNDGDGYDSDDDVFVHGIPLRMQV